jgi:hypothetical protein
VNRELPFCDPAGSELDEYFARIDRQLDALFLGELLRERDATLDEVTGAGLPAAAVVA